MTWFHSCYVVKYPKHLYDPKSIKMNPKNEQIQECEKNLILALKHNPLVRLLLEALRDSGCQVIPHRHLVKLKEDIFFSPLP